MSAIPGSVRVEGFIAPTDSTDTYAVTDPTYGRGSLRSVANIAARNAITKDRRLGQLGMEVITIDTLNKYRLINEPGTDATTDSDWELLNTIDNPWDGSIPFSTYYTQNGISTLDVPITVVLKGTGHTIDNKGSTYTNMQKVAFDSLDSIRTINIADGATMTSLPDLFAQVTLNSQSSSFVVVDPAAVKPFYVGRACWLSCSTSCKLVSLTGSTNIIIRLSGGYVYGPQVFDLAGSSVLNIFSDEIPYIGATSFYGTSGTSLNFTYSSDTPIPLKSQLVNFTGTVAYIPSCDNGNLKNVATVKWDGAVAFSDFYRQQNIATLTGSLIVSLVGTGHIINSLGATYTNMKYVAFQSLDGVRIVNIAQNSVIDNVPTLVNNVTLQSYSTASICTNPTSVINVGFGCTLACYSGVSGAKFVSLTTAHSATCFLNSGTLQGIEIFQLANTSTLSIAAINVSQIDPNSIYGVSGTNLYLNYDSDSPAVSPTDLTNFAGTVHYLTMALSSQIQGGPLQLSNLAALNSWSFTSQLVVGQWGYTQDTGKVYILTSTSPVTWTEYIPIATTGSIETLNIVSDGQTSFTLSNTPTSIFGIILNQGTFVKYGIDFIVSGNILTWLNPNGITIDIGDTAYFIYSYTASSPLPVTKYMQIPITGTLSTSNVFYPFDSFLTNSSSTIGIMYTFDVPDDLTTLISLTLPGFVHSSSAGGGPYNYTFTVNYAVDGELSGAHTTTFVKSKNFTGVSATTLQKPMFDLTSDLSSTIVAGRKIGIAIVSDLTHHIALSNATLTYI
jgi:hypothetical protein